MLLAYNSAAVLGVLALAPAITGSAIAHLLGRNPRASAVGGIAVLVVAGIAGALVAPWNSGVESWPYTGRQYAALAAGTLLGLAALARSVRGSDIQLVAVRRYAWMVLVLSALGLCLGAAGYAMTASLAAADPGGLQSAQQLALIYALITAVSFVLIIFAIGRLFAIKPSVGSASAPRAV